MSNQKLPSEFIAQNKSDIYQEWQDMPEFTRFNNKPLQRIIINFRTRDDVMMFAFLLGINNITSKTRSLWYPPYKVPTGIYVDDGQTIKEDDIPLEDDSNDNDNPGDSE
jgi:hypothetical protein